MEVKKKIFYLDFIRVIAMLFIVTYHFAVHFQSHNLPVISFFADGRLGMVGVAMFFVISGSSLIYNYDKKIDIKTYYKKRFLGIYPMFWIAYSVVFLKRFYDSKGFFTTLPIYKLIFSFFAMDGYLNIYTETVYILGEWFIGCIILIYILFPILRLAMKKFPKCFFVLCIVLDLVIILFSNFKMDLSKNLIVHIISFILGMYFVKYVKSCKWWHAVIALIITLTLFNIPIKIYKYKILFYNLAGYGMFFVLYYIGNKININTIKNVVNVLSEYSYAVFLVHHCIIVKIAYHFNDIKIDKYGIICVYLICIILIVIFSKLLYNINKKIINLLTTKNS